MEMSDNNETSTSKKLKSTNTGHELDKEHYVATCLACDQTFQPEKTGIMEKHIINCSKVDHSI
ncbi:6782_t:CDS:2, partial [Funneliformis geosporum]